MSHLREIDNYVKKNPYVFYLTAAISLFIGLLGFLILEWSHFVYGVSAVSKVFGLPLTELSELMPETVTYGMFAMEWVLFPIFFVTFVISIWAGLKRFKPWILIGYGVVNISIFVMAFLSTSYIVFHSQHYSAKFITVDEFIKSDFKKQNYGTATSSKNRALVLEINGDARAYPFSYITQTHIAGGEKIGGQNVVMTFCGLSHLGVPYENELDGQKLNLKVMGQFHNNLVMFDANTREPIHQIKGTMENSKRPLKEVPSVIMDLDNFVKLYPNGKVYYRDPKGQNLVDAFAFWLLKGPMGLQYDPSTIDLSFDTSPFLDRRIGAKERVYAIVRDGKSIVFTKEFIVEKSDGHFELDLGDQTITIKYFEDFDYIDMFVGKNAREVNHLGILPDGRKLKKFRHKNQILWRVYQYFYPKSVLYK